MSLKAISIPLAIAVCAPVAPAQSVLTAPHGQDALSAFAPNAKMAIRTRRVNVDSQGVHRDRTISSNASISANGRFVVFDSIADNLVPGDTNHAEDVFVRDTQDGSVSRASVWGANGQSDWPSNTGFISDDGRYVLFQSAVINDSIYLHWAVFLRDRESHTTTRISGTPSADSHTGGLTPDGRYAIFQSSAALVGDDSNQAPDVYRWDRADGSLARVSVATNGDEMPISSYVPADISDDGRFVCFASDAAFDEADTNGTRDIYLRDLGASGNAPKTELISKSWDGSAAASFSTENLLSADGNHVAFTSMANNIVPNDTNGTWDAFLHDRRTGVTTRVSTTNSGAEISRGAGLRGFSPDGRYVLFSSSGSDVVPNDQNGADDLFLKDVMTGAVTRVSVAANGAEANGSSDAWPNNQSVANGPRVVFRSYASNLDPDDRNFVRDIFLRDLPASTTTRVSAGPGGVETGGSFASFPSFSGDANLVAFQSSAVGLVPDDTDDRDDVFVHNMATGETRRASESPSRADASGPAIMPAMSRDGRYVTFQSQATNLVAGASLPSGVWQIFRKDMQTGAVALVSCTVSGVASDRSCKWSALNADGRYVVFCSDAGNLARGAGIWQQVYYKDMQTGVLECVSVSVSGAPGNGSSEAGRISITPDGRFVGFGSRATNLVTGDTNGALDAFVRDMTADVTERLSVNNLGVQVNGSSFQPVLSDDGRYAVFQSYASNLGSPTTVEKIFVRDRARGVTEFISKPTSGQPTATSWDADISADGRFVIFDSYLSNLVGDDTNADTDIFRYDRLLGHMERVSLSDSGGQVSRGQTYYWPALSSDGQWVAMVSDAPGFVPEDEDSSTDVFVRGPLPVPPGGYTFADAAWALRLAGGLAANTDADKLNAVPATPGVTVEDAAAVAREAFNLGAPR